jgi:hypothetical protein
MTDFSTRELACAITMQAVRDYFDCPESGKKAILKELRSKYMEFITNGTSVIVAEQLELHPEEIRTRLQKNGELKK